MDQDTSAIDARRSVGHVVGQRLEGTEFLRRLFDDFAGRRLTAAREFLTRLDGFERE